MKNLEKREYSKKGNIQQIGPTSKILIMIIIIIRIMILIIIKNDITIGKYIKYDSDNENDNNNDNDDNDKPHKNHMKSHMMLGKFWIYYNPLPH